MNIFDSVELCSVFSYVSAFDACARMSFLISSGHLWLITSEAVTSCNLRSGLKKKSLWN